MLDAANVLSHPISYVADGKPTYFSPDIIDIQEELAARYACLGFLNTFHVIFHQALLIQTIKPGIVHCFQDYSNVLVGIAADLVGVPRIVLSGRSLAPEHFGIFQPYMAPGYRALLKRRQVTFLNNSEAGAIDYGRWLGISRDHFRVINNGFEFPTLQQQLGRLQRRALGVPEDALLIGSIIGFREEKRPKLFIEMARALQASYPNAHFAIFGSGALLRACQQLVETQQLSGTIHLPGLTRNAWAALSAMDVFVLPSRLEGLPNVLIEAQAMGVPVICSGAGGMAETFVEGETGFAVPSASAEALAAAVGRLIDDKELRRRMSAAAETHAREKFSIDRMIGLTIEAYADTPLETSRSV
jgi:glycosyltransferase involved in cell wall biosynthesis